MEKSTCFRSFAMALVLVIAMPVINGQSSTTCTGAMVRNFTPCISFLASGSNTSTPSVDCCNSLRSLMSNGQDCLCLMITGGVAFQVPLNQTLAMSLPRACKTSGVPIECKDTQNPGEGGSSMSPPSNKAPVDPRFSPPESDIIPTLTPPGFRPILTSAAAHPSHINVLPSLVAVLGFILFVKGY
ncbi:hypothetical protein ABFS82_07G034000 [Erythranthe guttata]